MYQHIVVGLDGSRLAEQVLPHVEALAKQFGSRVTLIRTTVSAEDFTRGAVSSVTAMAGAGPITDPGPILEADAREAATYLEALVSELARRGASSVAAEYPAGNPSQVLLERARALGADLLALTTHGRGGLGRLFYGSVAEDIVRRTPIPVLLVRVRDDNAPGR